MVISTIKLGTPAPAPAPLASATSKATTLAQPSVTTMTAPTAKTTSMMDGMKALATASPVSAPVPAPAPQPAPAAPTDRQIRHMNYVEKALGWKNYLVGTANGDDYYQGPGGAKITGKEIDRRIENKKKYGIEDPTLLDKIFIGIFG